MRGLLRIKVRPYYLFHCDPVIGAGHFRTSVWKGLEIMEGLRGHMSGLGIPTYVVDSPHGGGKIPLMPNYLVSAVRRRGRPAQLRGHAGPLPGRGQADTRSSRPRPAASAALLQGDKTALMPGGQRADGPPAEAAAWSTESTAGCGDADGRTDGGDAAADPAAADAAPPTATATRVERLDDGSWQPHDDADERDRTAATARSRAHLRRSAAHSIPECTHANRHRLRPEARRARSPPGCPDDLHEEFDSPVTVAAIADVLRGAGPRRSSSSATAGRSSKPCSTTRRTSCSTSPRARASAARARPACRPSARCSASRTPAPTRSRWPSRSTRT